MTAPVCGRMLLISADTQWGGFHWYHGATLTRVCLGYVAVTWFRIPEEAMTGAILRGGR